MLRSLLSALMLMFLAPFAAPQTAATTPKAKEPMDTVLVFGDDFLFSLKEPDGWHCVCDERAMQYGVNAVVFPSAPDSRAHHLMIRIRVNKKSDENTALDLKADMQDYKQKYPNVEFAALDLSHPEYKTYTKVFQFPDGFHDYVAYINSGPQTWFTLSVSMTTEKLPATPDELAAFKKVVQSLRIFTNDPRRPH